MMRGDTSTRPTLWLVVGRGIGSAATLLMPMVLARVFDPHDFGTYKQLSLLYTTLYLIAPLGMAESLYYFVPRERDGAGPIVANTLLFLGAAGGAAVLLLVVVAPTVVVQFSNPDLEAYRWLVGLFVALTVASSLLEIVMISRRQYPLAASTFALSDLARTACLVLPALLWRRLDAVFAGAVAFGGVRLLATLAYSFGSFRGTFRPNLAALSRQLAYAVPFGAAAILEVVQGNLHQYVVAHAFDAATFAVYSVGCLQVPIVDLLAGSAGNVLMVRMAESQQHAGAARALWLDTTAKLALVLLPLFGLLVVSSHDLIVLLYTDVYGGSARVFRVFCVSVLLTTLQTDAVLRARAETRYLLRLSLLRLCLVAALIAPCLRTFHLVGGAVATVVSVSVVKAFALVRVKRTLQAGLRDWLPWRTLGVAALATSLGGAASLACHDIAGGGVLGSLCARSAAYGLACVATLWVLRPRSRGLTTTLAWLRPFQAGEGSRPA
jgi:O-antigen/teichoic acid export membrane protein